MDMILGGALAVIVGVRLVVCVCVCGEGGREQRLPRRRRLRPSSSGAASGRTHRFRWDCLHCLLHVSGFVGPLWQIQQA